MKDWRSFLVQYTGAAGITASPVERYVAEFSNDSEGVRHIFLRSPQLFALWAVRIGTGRSERTIVAQTGPASTYTMEVPPGCKAIVTAKVFSALDEYVSRSTGYHGTTAGAIADGAAFLEAGWQVAPRYTAGQFQTVGQHIAYTSVAHDARTATDVAAGATTRNHYPVEDASGVQTLCEFTCTIGWISPLSVGVLQSTSSGSKVRTFHYLPSPWASFYITNSGGSPAGVQAVWQRG